MREHGDALSAGLVDTLTELMARPGGVEARSRRIVRVVDEMIDAVVWLHGSQPNVGELQSLQHLRAAAWDHAEAMARLGQTNVGIDSIDRSPTAASTGSLADRPR